jgi:hypothetical protein
VVAAILALAGTAAGRPQRHHQGPYRQLIVGTNGSETLRGTRGADLILTGRGRDVIVAGRGSDVIVTGEPGQRAAPPVHAYGGRGSDEIHTGGGDDVAVGGRGPDTIFTGFGHDRVRGGTGRDNLHGQNAGDQLFGGRGKDHVTASGGNDSAGGGPGRDSLNGGPGDDRVFGGAADDTLYLWTGDDRGFGMGGWDWIGGNLGDDWLVGGPGVDIGSDKFGHNRVVTEYGRHRALAGHPLYDPPDDRCRRLPHLDGRAAHQLRRGVKRLRGLPNVGSWAEVRTIRDRRSRLFSNAQEALVRRHHGVRDRGVAILALERLQEAYSAELDRLTVQLVRQAQQG